MLFILVRKHIYTIDAQNWIKIIVSLGSADHQYAPSVGFERLEIIISKKIKYGNYEFRSTTKSR